MVISLKNKIFNTVNNFKLIFFTTLIISFIFIVSFYNLSSIVQITNAQTTTIKDLVKYQRQSSFIKEFNVPIKEVGLKGITTDSQGNAWFYHSTNKTSSIFMFNPATNSYRQFNVSADTVVDDFVTNLAGGQLVFDDSRNAIWFTDARTNSIGRLDINTGQIALSKIPTPASGPMGIVLSPDEEEIWFTEILGNKIAYINITSNGNNNQNESNYQITEYPVSPIQEQGEAVAGGGPTLLTFDKRGILWVTMSYSHDILRIEPWALISGTSYMGISNFSLPNHDIFSPFGIAIITNNSSLTSIGNRSNSNTYGNDNQAQRIFLSDHGSSRVIMTLGNPDVNPLQKFTTYWTSPSQVYPTTLPGQIVSDKNENIYFVQHGGNRISKIDLKSGIMTEYDIPTGPLSTSVFLAVSENGQKVWFTEHSSNKIAYLDTTIPIPYQMQVSTESSNQNEHLIKKNESTAFDVSLINKVDNASNNISTNTSLLSLDDIGLSLTGMTDSGLTGIIYSIDPSTVNLTENKTTRSQLKLNLVNEEQGNQRQTNLNTRYENYTIMTRSSTLEKNNLVISLLYPISIKLDVPVSTSSPPKEQNNRDNSLNNPSLQEEKGFLNISGDTLRNTLRIVSLPVAIGLIAYIILRKIKERKTKK